MNSLSAPQTTQPEKIQITREIPVRYDVDVFVVGGGPAGVAAAVAAAKQGAKVFLAEQHSCFGGMGTAGMVPVFMEFGDGVNFLAGGVGGDLLDRLHAAGGTTDYRPESDRGGCVRANGEVLKRVYDDLVSDAGVAFTFHTSLIGVEKEGKTITAAICASKSGIFAVRAHTYVDCSGNGDLCAWAGAPFEKGNEKGEMQPGTLCQLWTDIDWDRVVNEGCGIEGESKLIPKGIEAGLFTIPDRGLPGIWPVSEKMGGGNVGHTFGVDGTDEASLTKALVWGRKLVLEYERFYKQFVKGFEQMTLAGTASLLGVRESRRILGDYVLNIDDYVAQAVFEDEIGRYAYTIDVHASKPGEGTGALGAAKFTSLRYKKGESYGIPYRCLVPRELDNALVGGRCISTDRSVNGSLRVMPGCFITGQAAGVAAAVCAAERKTTRQIEVREVQRRLLAINAYLPNAAV